MLHDWIMTCVCMTGHCDVLWTDINIALLRVHLFQRQIIADEIEMYPTERERNVSVFFKTVKKQNYGEGLGVEGRCKVQNDVVGNMFLTEK
jgi:hypothetical protein